MASNLEFISRTETSGAVNVSVENCFNTFDYDHYVINIEDAQFSARAGINMRLINSGGVISTSKYDRAQLQLRNDSSFTETRNSDQTSFTTISATSGGADEFGGTWIEVFNPTIASAYTFVTMQHSSYYDTVSGDLLGYKFIGVYKEAEAVTGFQLIQGSGANFDPLIVNVFGVS
tara:strand:- start:84 stop:608 length:525 start_codon:yes stop_codon:yes gene_type:complete